MPTTYENADAEVYDLAAELIHEHYPDLLEAEVKLLIHMAYASRDDEGHVKGPALKHGGYPAAGLVRATNAKERRAGLADVWIWLDGDQYPEWSAKRQEGTLRHEIHHILVRRGKGGEIQLDDYGRPLLRMRKHDHQIGIFDEIVKEYGEDAWDGELLRLAAMRHKPLFSDWESAQTEDAADENTATRGVNGAVKGFLRSTPGVSVTLTTEGGSVTVPA